MKKILVANRGEIAIRVFRAATELGLETVSVYSHEDRYSLHRFKADESYQIGPPEGGEPVKAYLNPEYILDVAQRYGVDAIHPGYGFMSENADFARACAACGVQFIGPTPEQLDMLGDKVAAKRLADEAGVPTIPGTEQTTADVATVRKLAKQIGFPLMVKASYGGGGRGMRVVERADELDEKLAEAQREAGAAFGRSEVFIERFIRRAKHIEVQILGDTHGNLMHLWDRDCSVQRRHQKVVEMAPSIAVPEATRREICAAAVRLCRKLNYVCAGTVEFLLDMDSGEFFFIEVNPRIQVEHTVTEIVTDVDLVKSQILITQGHALHAEPIGIPQQDALHPRGVAIQCRVTTEDAENQFIPDYGRLSTYRSPGGMGVRLDAGSAFGGAVITPFFDSLLVKITTWGHDLRECVRRMDRALREFRVRGVKTNIPFLENLINHADFLSGSATTDFVDRTPELFKFKRRRDRATRLLNYLGEVIVNGRPEVGDKHDPEQVYATPKPPAPAFEGHDAPAGLRPRLLREGPEKFAAWVRKQRPLLFTDTTMRDAHQSLLATRVRSYDMLKVAEATARLAPQLFSLEMWGGATFDVAMRFLDECPWQRLRELRRRIPDVPFQMLLRASNAVGYTNYPDNVVREFVKVSAAEGIDVFRIFDSLNWTENMKLAMQTVREDTSAICEAAICYTGDILDPDRPKYHLDYFINMARELVAMGAHIIAIKDMAGLCKPPAAAALIKALRQEVDVPLHFHTHDTSGVSAASALMAAGAGVDVVDGALSAISGLTAQPCLNSMAAAVRNTPRDSGLSADALDQLSDYWADVRAQYAPFEEDIKSPTSEVYRHEMPGGQYTNLRQQAKSLGLGERWPEVCAAYATANQLFGDIVKVTPSSKVVGDLAMFMVHNNLTREDVLNPTRQLNFPQSVVDMMQGLLGRPADGWPKKFRKVVLDSAGVKGFNTRPGARLKNVDWDESRKELAKKIHREPDRRDLLAYLLYPKVFVEYQDKRRQYGDVSVLPTPVFFYGMKPQDEIAVEIETGKTLIIRYLTTGDLHEDGTRTVFFELNGQPRSVRVTDQSTDVERHVHPKADPDNANHVPAPMPGKVSKIDVEVGEAVSKGQPLLALEAMKMETTVYAQHDAKVGRIEVNPGSIVEAGDLLVELQ
jgi:pyruvate carboxylase